MKRIKAWLTDPEKAMRFHACLVIFWIVMIPPTLMFWPESILFLALMSLWANIAAHWAAYQGSHAEKMEQCGLDNEDLDKKLDLVIELLSKKE